MARRQLSVDYSCPKCSKVLQQPKYLKCLHCFCINCIKEEVAEGKVICYVCDKVTEINHSIEDLPTPYHILDRMEIEEDAEHSECKSCKDGGKVVSYCNKCLHICESCSISHKRMKSFDSHKVKRISEIQNDDPLKTLQELGKKTTCKNHKDEELKYFCITCKKSVCRDCECRQKHEHILLEEERFESMRSILEELRTKEQTVSDGAEQINKVLSEVPDRASKCEEEIDKHFKKLEEKISKHKSKLKQKISNIKDAKLTALRNQHAQLNRLKSEMEHVVRNVDTGLKSNNKVSIANCTDFFNNSMQETINKIENTDTQPITIYQT